MKDSLEEYTCHKKVQATKIGALDMTETGECTITPLSPYLDVFVVDAAFIKKHKPEVGGYFVLYQDGYKSYSPARAFEDGYSLA